MGAGSFRVFDCDRLAVFFIPAFVVLRPLLSGAGIVLGLPGSVLLVDVVPRLVVAGIFLLLVGGVGGAPVPLAGVLGGIVISVVRTQRWASSSCVRQVRGIKQVSVVEYLPR